MTQFEQDLERAVENNKRQEADIEHLENIIKIMRETILAYSERVNMYELKVGKLRRTIGEYIDKYGLQ